MNTRSKPGKFVNVLLLAAVLIMSIQTQPVMADWYSPINPQSSSERNILFQPDVVYVDDDFTASTPGWGVDHFASIQPGIDAVNGGGTVNVAAGAYAGQLVISKDLILTGENKTSVIQATVSMPDYFMTASPNYPIVYIKDNATVTIQGFTIDGLGLGNSNYRFVGIGFHNAAGNVLNNDVVNVSDTPFSGAQHGTAIFTYNEDAIQRTITVTGNTINGFQKNAMALNSADDTPLWIDVEDNTIVGAGATPITAQNGIQVWSALGSGIVAGNNISEIGYDNSSSITKWVGSSILNFYADLAVSDNVITNAQEGIYFIDASGLIDGNELTISRAGVSANGINADDPPTAIPSPIDPPARNSNGVMAGQQSISNVEISNNTIIFPEFDNYYSVGVQADTGYGDTDLAINIHHNKVAGFYNGLVFIQCDEVFGSDPCTPSVFTDISIISNDLLEDQNSIYIQGTTLSAVPEIHFNRIYTLASNAFGLIYFAESPVNAQNNWWGCSDGPALNSRPYGCMPFDDPFFKVIIDSWLSIQMPVSLDVYVNESTDLTADLLHTLYSEDTSSAGVVPDGIEARFTTFLGTTTPVYPTSVSGYITTTYTAPGVEGNDTVCIFLDAAVLCALAVVHPNDVPVAESQAVQTNEDTSLEITLAAIDDYPGILSWTVGDPGHGTLTGEAPALTYTPDLDWYGTDSFTFVVNDGMDDSNTATVTIDIAPVNDPPAASELVDTEWLAREPHTLVIPAFTDADGDTLTYTASLADGSPLPAWLSFDDAALTLSGSPANSDSGLYQIKVTASDGVAAVSTTFTLTITLNPYTCYLPVIGK